jgi:hypothetical protein
MLSDWVSFLAYPNLFGIKGFVVVVVVDMFCFGKRSKYKNDRYSCHAFREIDFVLIGFSN